jgi:hypothetical protein
MSVKRAHWLSVGMSKKRAHALRAIKSYGGKNGRYGYKLQVLDTLERVGSSRSTMGL